MKHHINRIVQSLVVIAFSICLLFATMKSYRFSTTSSEGEWEFTAYSDVTGNQNLFCTIYNETTRQLVVIDSGWAENIDQVRSVINEKGGVVDAWFITHYHSDHVDAFDGIYFDPQGIEIKAIYDSYVDDLEYYASVCNWWDTIGCYQTYMSLTEGDNRIHHLYRGDTLDIGSLHVECFNSMDDIIKESGSDDIPNDLSLVLKFSGTSKSVLLCADCRTVNISNILMNMYGEELSADVLLPGHHGNNSFPTSFYDLVDPKMVLFNAPGWLMEKEDLNADDLNEYLVEQGVDTYSFADGDRISFSLDSEELEVSVE